MWGRGVRRGVCGGECVPALFPVFDEKKKSSPKLNYMHDVSL